MLRALRRRGPDGSGIFQDDDGTLGHVRLAIVDPASGPQPLMNEDGSLWVAFNGEIYNHARLRQGLRGHQFRTRTDTEVLVHLYEEHGPEMVSQLDGMFAFAIYRPARGARPPELLLARDPLGIKPLYYGYAADGTLYFASELRALLCLVERPREFPAGTWFHSRRGFHRYFELPRESPDITDPEEAVAGLRERLEQAVRKRLMADVPLGVFLSGGLDSSLISAMARRYVEGELHSFAVGVRGCPDLAASRQVAAALGTVHHVRELEPDDVIRALPRVIYHLESFDPALVRSAIPTYFVSRLAGRYVKVVLSGEGADELFAGYPSLAPLAAAKTQGRQNGCALHDELVALTNNLHHTNLQRVDRMTMACSIEGRVPFLDLAAVRYGLRIHPDLKWRTDEGEGVPEKWILRRLAEHYLPSDIAWRKKEKFAKGTGIADLLAKWADAAVTDADWNRSRQPEPGLVLDSKEAVAYYRIFRRFFPQKRAIDTVGRTRSVTPEEFLRSGA